MISSFSDHLQQKFPEITTKSKLLVAFSGGLDSVVLADLLIRLGYEISLAHVNFSLRNNESEEDAAFADQYANEKNIPLFSQQVDTKNYAAANKLSIQEAAREIRYHWFEQLLQTENLDYILTAHHADDQLETVFINFIRGTGLQGFTGIPEKRGEILRPLLPFAKAELKKFALHNNIHWREDSSNRSVDYLRNQIRHQLMPSFKQVNEDAFQQAQKSINLAKESYQLFEELLQEKLNKIVKQKDDKYFIDVTLLQQQEQAKTLLFYFIKRFGFRNIQEVDELLTKPKGKWVENKNYSITKERDYLVLQPIQAFDKKKEFEIKVESGTYQLPLGTIKLEIVQNIRVETSKNVSYIDLNHVGKVLILRKWKKGDTFQPLGMKGQKKVSDFLKDEKTPFYEKKDQWVLLSNNKIVWVVNHRIDDRFKVNNNTKQCLKISYLG